MYQQIALCWFGHVTHATMQCNMNFILLIMLVHARNYSCMCMHVDVLLMLKSFTDFKELPKIDSPKIYKFEVY